MLGKQVLPDLQYLLGDSDSNNVILSFLRAKAVFDFPLSTNRANWIQVSRMYVLQLTLCLGMSRVVQPELWKRSTLAHELGAQRLDLQTQTRTGEPKKPVFPSRSRGSQVSAFERNLLIGCLYINPKGLVKVYVCQWSQNFAGPNDKNGKKHFQDYSGSIKPIAFFLLPRGTH